VVAIVVLAICRIPCADVCRLAALPLGGGEAPAATCAISLFQWHTLAWRSIPRAEKIKPGNQLGGALPPLGTAPGSGTPEWHSGTVAQRNGTPLNGGFGLPLRVTRSSRYA